MARWPSVAVASESLGFPSSGILAACKGQRATSNGHVWKYADPTVASQYKPKEQTKIKKVIVWDFQKEKNVLPDDQVFNDPKGAAKYLETSDGFIRTLCNNNRDFINGKRESYKIYKSKYVVVYENVFDESIILDKKRELEGMAENDKGVTTCKICSMTFKNLTGFTTHLQTAHKISAVDYTIQYLGKNSTCAVPGCCNKTKYLRLDFFSYCSEHATVAMSENKSKEESVNKD